MKVVVQRIDTTEYTALSGAWTRSVDFALNFEKGEQADQFSSKERTIGLRIIFKFDKEENRTDIVIPPKNFPRSRSTDC